MKLALPVHEILHPPVLKGRAVLQPMGIKARISERTLSAAEIENFAGNIAEVEFIVFENLFFVSARFVVEVRGDHQEGVGSADWAGSVVRFCCFFVEGRPPVSDAAQAENVVAVLQQAEDFSLFFHHLEADRALVVAYDFSFFVSFLFFSSSLLDRLNVV